MRYMILLICLLTACNSSSTNGGQLSPPDNQGPIPPPDPVFFGSVYGYFRHQHLPNDAARLPSLTLLDSTGSVVSSIQLTWQGDILGPTHLDMNGLFNFTNLPLGTYTVATTYFDSAWGIQPDIIWRSSPTTLRLDKFGLYVELDASIEWGRVPYLFAVRNLEERGNQSITAGYRVVNDPKGRVWVTSRGGEALSAYPPEEEGVPFDRNNDGNLIESLAAPLGETVKVGWYIVPNPVDHNDPYETLSQVQILAETEPTVVVSSPDESSAPILLLDFAKPGDLLELR